MRSSLPKVLHPVCGSPLVTHVIHALEGAGVSRVIVVLGPGRDDVRAVLPESCTVAVQGTQRGTGDALLAADRCLGDGPVLVVPGDTPLLTSAVFQSLMQAYLSEEAAAAVLTMCPPDPSGYGRVVRGADGTVLRIVEHRDASVEELSIGEVNVGAFVLPARLSVDLLSRQDAANEQGEVYLTDVVAGLRELDQKVVAVPVEDHRVALGVNTRVELAEAQEHMRMRICVDWMLAGVTIEDPASTHIDATVTLEPDVRLLPFTCLRGATHIAARSEIGPSSTLVDTRVGADCRVRHSYTDGAVLEAGVQVGPFTYLRPEAHLADGAKAGAFVEIKKSRVGPGSKVPHLSYIGDTTIGKGTNIGAGNITANFDGREKHRTVIGDNVRTGSDTVFVAPVTVADGATTGAGSVVTKDVPAGALGIARARQHNILDYAARARALRAGAAGTDASVPRKGADMGGPGEIPEDQGGSDD
ncbi:MAG: bifunctional UDP-N-acetylglucosamine diphosphorylase/glucosamine-1-phosphate N-acetyltransferase GlmU [Actinobacteria bacterium]|nr:bifunctional UDP-N-acetylglucosamine diphosphorylase/glucosamine-1-phosphate N-acetyltransferase GlmU [Actinomycetota bacterium]